jgi:hypothetical protein
VSEGGSTVISVRLSVTLAAALKAEADRREQSVSALVRSLATEAGIGAAGEPSRIEALEARVAALEARQGSRATPRREKPVARRSAPENRQQRQPTTRRYADDDPKRAVRPSDLPPGFPSTGAELEEWHRRSGLSGRAFAEAVGGVTRQAVAYQAKKGDRPLSLGFALSLVEAVEAGRLPAP